MVSVINVSLRTSDDALISSNLNHATDGAVAHITEMFNRYVVNGLLMSRWR